MKLKVSRVEVWVTDIDDRPGGLAAKLARLAEAGANLGFVLARRKPEQPGNGVVFLSPLKGARQFRAAAELDFLKSESIQAVRIEAADKPGLGARMAAALAQAGINLRGLSATAVGKTAVSYLAFDTADDAARAVKALKKLA